MPQMKTDKCLSCIIYNHAACIIVLLSIVIILCTIVIDICFDTEKNPGPLLGNSASYESINSHFCLSHSGELTADFKSYLSLIHLNIQSLKPKCDIINAELSDFDILCFTESWLDATTKNDDIALEGFDFPFRNDRTDRPGGGVIVYCKSDLVCKRRSDLEVRGVECIWIELHLKKQQLSNRNFL